MITFDRSDRSVVAVCDECGARDVFASPAAADRWAADHAGSACAAPSGARTRFLTAARVRKHRAARAAAGASVEM